MDPITVWLNDASSRKITPEETLELFVRLGQLEKGTKEHRAIINRICEGNLLLLYKAVKSFSDKKVMRWGTEKSLDMLQAGYFGLLAAAERFDISRGNRFSTVAVPWIRQRVSRYLYQKEAPIYVPEHVAQEVLHLKLHGRTSGNKSAPKNPNIIKSAQAALEYHLSLDVKPRDADGCTLGDLLEAPDTAKQSEDLDEKRKQIETLMRKAKIGKDVQGLILEYVEKGRLQSAAVNNGIAPSRARGVYNSAIRKLKALV